MPLKVETFLISIVEQKGETLGVYIVEHQTPWFMWQ
jgi:hypothetical protein